MTREFIRWMRTELALAEGRRECARSIGAAIATCFAFGFIALLIVGVFGRA